MRKLFIIILITSMPKLANSQDGKLPIIDVHMHGGYRAGKFILTEDGTPLPRPVDQYLVREFQHNLQRQIRLYLELWRK